MASNVNHGARATEPLHGRGNDGCKRFAGCLVVEPSRTGLDAEASPSISQLQPDGSKPPIRASSPMLLKTGPNSASTRRDGRLRSVG